jgi:hypothetical protein
MIINVLWHNLRASCGCKNDISNVRSSLASILTRISIEWCAFATVRHVSATLNHFSDDVPTECYRIRSLYNLEGWYMDTAEA